MAWFGSVEFRGTSSIVRYDERPCFSAIIIGTVLYSVWLGLVSLSMGHNTITPGIVHGSLSISHNTAALRIIDPSRPAGDPRRKGDPFKKQI